MSERVPGGNLSVRSTRMNLWRGVDAADGVALALALEELRSCCGHVTVQDWKAIVWDCWSRGRTADTSAVPRYYETVD
jgi:hypothetical protein